MLLITPVFCRDITIKAMFVFCLCWKCVFALILVSTHHINSWRQVTQTQIKYWFHGMGEINNYTIISMYRNKCHSLISMYRNKCRSAACTNFGKLCCNLFWTITMVNKDRNLVRIIESVLLNKVVRIPVDSYFILHTDWIEDNLKKSC